jgi:hypothetical protein
VATTTLGRPVEPEDVGAFQDLAHASGRRASESSGSGVHPDGTDGVPA